MGCKGKKINQRETPKGKDIVQGGNPEQYYAQRPAWAFQNADREMWAFSHEHIGTHIWTDILPKLSLFETQTWGEILIVAKTSNHAIDVNSLNKSARNRLAEKHIEAESIISLRLSGNHRLYGYMTGSVFNILWFDDNHGDNASCVCRSKLKHT